MKINYKRLTESEIEKFVEFIDWKKVPLELLISMKVIQFYNLFEELDKQITKSITRELIKNKISPQFFNKIKNLFNEGFNKTKYNVLVCELSIVHNHSNILKLCLEHNLDKLETLFIKNSGRINKTSLKIFLDVGLDLHLDKIQIKSMDIACKEGNLKLIKALVHKGFDVKTIDSDIISLLARKGQKEILEFLIQSGANYTIEKQSIIEKKSIKKEPALPPELPGGEYFQQLMTFQRLFGMKL